VLWELYDNPNVFSGPMAQKAPNQTLVLLWLILLEEMNKLVVMCTCCLGYLCYNVVVV